MCGVQRAPPLHHLLLKRSHARRRLLHLQRAKGRGMGGGVQGCMSVV